MKRQVVCLTLILVLFSFPLIGQTPTPDFDPALYAVGSLAAGNVYLSYLVLGTVADGYAQGIYDDVVATSIVSEALFLNSNADDSLNTLLSTGNLTPEDESVIQRIRGVYQLLTNQGEALIRFISDPNDTGELFQRSRELAWNEISLLLGF